jgi:hypothetical protein
MDITCLFIDSSKLTAKAVLLHNGNKYISVQIASTFPMKVSCNNMGNISIMVNIVGASVEA